MGLEKVDVADSIQKWRTDIIYDHFNNYTSPGLWTSITTGGGSSVAVGDADGGILTLTTGASQNNEAGFSNTNKVATFVKNKSMFYQIGLSYTDLDTNNAGIVLGMASSWTHILADTTYALPTTLSAACIYKKPGDTFWSAFGSVGTTQSTQLSTQPTQNAGIAQNFIVQVTPNANSQVEIAFWQGGVGVSATAPYFQPMLYSTTSIARQQAIKFFIAYSGAAGMQFGAFLKAGSGTSQVVSVDYIGTGFLSIP